MRAHMRVGQIDVGKSTVKVGLYFRKSIAKHGKSLQLKAKHLARPIIRNILTALQVDSINAPNLCVLSTTRRYRSKQLCRNPTRLKTDAETSGYLDFLLNPLNFMIIKISRVFVYFLDNFNDSRQIKYLEWWPKINPHSYPQRLWVSYLSNHYQISLFFFNLLYRPIMNLKQPRQLRPCFMQGMRAMIPFLPGIVPFGVVTGFTPISFGFTWIDSWLGSLLMFAGASQLATYQLMNEGASIWIILLTVTAINLRYVLYSASIAPHLADANRLIRFLVGYGLSDQIYPICHRDYRAHEWGLEERIAYYAGGTLLLWGLWQACTIIGAFAGRIIPVFWSLEFMIPLTFLTLALQTLKTMAHRVTAVSGALVSFVGLDLPYSLGLILGAISGVGFGVLYQRMIR